MESGAHSSGPQLAMARFKELNAFKRPPVTVSPIKLDTSSVPSRM